jgi:predicted metal-binding protein
MKAAKSGWAKVVLVCAKCTRKVGGGFGEGGGRSLAKELRRAVGKGRKARAGVVEVKCLKLCPKRAVVVVDAAHPRDWLVVPAGEPVEAVAARLGLIG